MLKRREVIKVKYKNSLPAQYLNFNFLSKVKIINSTNFIFDSLNF
jgi:hypothetical protein